MTERPVHPLLRPRYDRVAARPKNRRSVRALVAEAEAVHAQYAQYRDHWNGWERVVVTQDVRTKLGLAFRAGDVALAKPLGDDPGRGRRPAATVACATRGATRSTPPSRPSPSAPTPPRDNDNDNGKNKEHRS